MQNFVDIQIGRGKLSASQQSLAECGRGAPTISGHPALQLGGYLRRLEMLTNTAKFQPKTTLVLGACAGALFFATAASNASVLFTTQNDWAQWTGSAQFTETPVATPDSDGSNLNGLGNSAGGTGTAGSLQLTWISGSFDYVYGPGEQTNQLFLTAVDPGAVASTSLTSYSGTMTFDITPPSGAPGSGGYYDIGIVLNYTSNFGQFFGTLSATANPNGFYTYTVPYTINAVSGLSYFQLGIIYNSNYTGSFNLDNFTVVPVPEPASICGLGVLSSLLLLRRRGAV